MEDTNHTCGCYKRAYLHDMANCNNKVLVIVVVVVVVQVAISNSRSRGSSCNRSLHVTQIMYRIIDHLRKSNERSSLSVTLDVSATPRPTIK